MRHPLRRPVTALVLVVALAAGTAACGSSDGGDAATDTSTTTTAAPVTTTTRTGSPPQAPLQVTVIGKPTCPVERPGKACTAPATQGRVLVFQGDAIIATVPISKGAAEVRLPIGPVRVSAQGTGFIRCPEMRVTVAAPVTKVTLTCDTGMR